MSRPFYYLRIVILGLFLSVIVGFYYHNHEYYKMALEYEYLRYLIVVILLIYLGFYFWGTIVKKKERFSVELSVWKIGLILGLSVVLIMNFVVVTKGVSIYLGEPVYELPDQQLVIVDEQQKAPTNGKLFLTPNQLLGKKAVFPPQIQANIKTFSWFGVQKAILGHLLFTFGQWLVLLLWLYVVGEKAFRLLKRRLYDAEIEPKLETLCAIGMGMGIISILMMILAALGIYFWWSVAAVISMPIMFSYRRICEIFKLFKKKFKWETNYFGMEMIFVAGFLVIFALNFIDNIRAYPNGWDAQERYLNFANLIGENGSLISGSHPYYWELFISIGYSLFQGLEGALMMTFLAGLLAACSLFLLLRRFLTRELSLILSSIFFSLPFVFFQSYGDPKTDLPLMFISNLAILALLEWYLGNEESGINEPDWYWKRRFWLYLAFLLAGLGLGIKYTGALLILALLATVMFVLLRWRGLLWGVLAAGLVFVSQDNFNIGRVFLANNKGLVLAVLVGVLALLGAGLFYSLLKRDRKIILVLMTAGIFLIIPFAPWLIKGYSETASFNPGKLLNGKDMTPYHELKELPFDTTQCKSSGFKEDYQRYIGFDSQWKNYLYLPWNLTMNTFAKGIYVDVSFIFLALIPLALMYLKVFQQKEPGVKLLALFGGIFWLYWMITANGVIWYGISGIPILLLVIGLIFRESEEGSSARRLLAWCFFIIGWLIPILLGEWGGGFSSLKVLAEYAPYNFLKEILYRVTLVGSDSSVLANGYILVFWLIVIAVIWRRSRALLKSGGYYFLAVILVGWLISSVALRLYTNGDPAILLYAGGVIDKHTAVSLVLPGYDFINNTFINDRSPENKYLLRIATPYGYFISDNKRRVISDQFLDLFACIYKEKDSVVTKQRLSDLGIKYILLDKFIPTIAQDENQTLTKKFNDFMEFSKNLRLIYETPEFRNTSFFQVP